MKERGLNTKTPRPRNKVEPNKRSLEVAVGANLPFQLNSALFCCFLFCFVLFWNCEHIKLVSCCWLCFQILPPVLKFGLRLATKFSNWLKIGVAWFEISSSQTFACHGLRWSRGWDRVEGNPAKKYRNEIFWLARLRLRTASQVLFWPALDGNFRTSDGTSVHTIEILIPDSRLTPKILSRRGFRPQRLTYAELA